MKLTQEKQHAHLAFESWTEALNYSLEHSHKCRLAVCNDVEFTGTNSYSEAHSLAIKGWPEGRKVIDKLASQIDCTSRVLQPETVFDVVGEVGIDVGLYLTGVPECVLDMRESDTLQASQGGIVRIWFNASAPGSAPHEAFIGRGAATQALIDALEASGRRVELTWCKANTVAENQPDTFLISVVIKRADEALQPDQLAFALTHPSANRRIGFSLTNMCGVQGRRAISYAHGAQWHRFRPDCDIYIPRLDPNQYEQWSTVASSKQWVMDMLKAQGVTLS